MLTLLLIRYRNYKVVCVCLEYIIRKTLSVEKCAQRRASARRERHEEGGGHSQRGLNNIAPQVGTHLMKFFLISLSGQTIPVAAILSL